MNKENLLKFASTIKNFNNLKHATRILWIGYYLQNNENYDFFKNTDVGECYELLDLNPPSNPSDSLKKLKEGNKLVPKKMDIELLNLMQKKCNQFWKNPV